MLAGESLAIAEEIRRSIERRYGADRVAEHFRSFDTICSATQERQDAVLALIQEPLDVMVVVGGYNSSNTCHLAALVQSNGVRTFHIEDADGVDPASGVIRHQPIGTKDEIDDCRLARREPGHRHHGRRVHAEQQGRRDDRADLRAGRPDRGAPRPDRVSPHRMRFLDLSHTIVHGMTTYPGLPGPIICDFLSRGGLAGALRAGVEFQIGKIEMVSNTGTYIDSPFHRYAEGKDLSQLPLESLAGSRAS